MCAFKVLRNTLNISHGHKFTGLLGRRTQVKSFKLTSISSQVSLEGKCK